MEQKQELLKFWKENFSFKEMELKAFSEVNREDFIPENLKDQAYEDMPLPILRGKTISQPSTVMMMTSALELKLKVLEPLKELYKDEVRKLGNQLKLPKEIIYRHPFPGPGLAIRILGEITQERLKILRESDYIFLEELHNSGYYDKTWQAFACLFPLKTVGVKGDARTYEYVISLRAVTSIDAMTADWARLPNSLLEKISSRILNEVKGVNRVVYDISQKPPATIEYE